MTTFEIVMACVGFILCAVIFTLVCIVIFGIVWWVFRTDKDIEIEDDAVIWAVCPYCEEEVELYGTGLQSCPVCGAHFEPSKEEVESSKQARL